MFRLFSTPTFRSAASQLCGAFPYYCLTFAFGSTLGFHITLIAELYKQDSEIVATVDQLSWFAGLDILSPLVLTVNGILTQRLGSRIVALAATTWYTTSWLFYHYSTSSATILVARTLTALAASTELSIPHVSEISEPRFRGVLVVICQMCTVLGSFFTLLLANFLHWRNIALINLVFPILAAISILFMPNSPAWLASKGRLDEAEKALCWLRGWVSPDQVQTEFRTLIDNVRNLNVETTSWQERSRQFFQLFIQRTFYLPLGTMCLIFCIYALIGIETTSSYAAIVFDKLNSPIEPPVATVFMGAAAIVGRFVLLFSIHHVGKRKLILYSVMVIALCYTAVALVGFLKLEGEYLWIPPIAVITSHLAASSGVEPTIFMLVSEIFPSSVRYIGTAITFSFSLVGISLMKKAYLYIVDAITLPGVFLVFAAGNLLAFVTYYFVVPETEGKSLEDIENHYRGVKKLDERKD